jgi:hypothetical protein
LILPSDNRGSVKAQAITTEKNQNPMQETATPTLVQKEGISAMSFRNTVKFKQGT